MTPRDLHERINQLAYLMWEAAGRQQGLAMEYWLAAERQVLAMMQTAMDTAMDRMMAPCRAAQPQRGGESKPAAPAAPAEETSGAASAAPSQPGQAPSAPAAVEPVAAQPAEGEPVAEEPAEAQPAAVEPAAVEPAAVEPAAVEPAPVEPAAAAAEAVEPPAAPESEPAPVPAEPATTVAEAVPGPEPAISVEAEAKTAGNGGLVEHRNRPIVRKDWIGQNVTLELDTNSGHYRVPHDVLWDFVKAHKTVESTKTWQQKGEYSWPKIPHDLLEFLSAYSQD